MKFRIRYADQIVGAFVLTAFALLALILIALGGQQRWFARDYRYVSRFTSGAGLSVGQPIHYKGFIIGRIKRVELNKDNQADVKLVIYDTYHDRVTENSQLELVISPIGLGNQLILNKGKTLKLAAEGSFIAASDSLEGKALVLQGLVEVPPKDDTITKVLASIGPIVEGINTTITELNKVMVTTGPRINTVMAAAGTDVPRILADVEASVAQVKGMTASISYILKNLEGTSDALKDPTGLVPKLLESDGSISTFFHDNNQLFNHVDGSLSSVEGTLRNLESSSGVLSAQMPRIAATIEEARTAIVQMQDVLEGLKNNPLLRGGIPERVESQAAPTSLRSTDF